METVSSRWITAREALRAGETGELSVVYPTRRNLEAMAEFDRVEDLLRAARSGEVDRRPHLPEIVRDGEAIAVRHPYTGEVDAP